MPWKAAEDVMRVYNKSLVMTLNSTAWGAGTGMPKLRLNMIKDPDHKDTILDADGQPSKLRLIIGTHRNMTICEVYTQYVQAQIHCSRAADNADLACYAKKIRHDPRPTDAENITAFDIGYNSAILQQIPYTLASNDASEAGILEKWLRDPPTALDSGAHLSKDNPDFWYQDLSLDVFAGRFAMALNTHLRASLDMSHIVGSDGTRVREERFWALTNGTWVEFTVPMYHLNWGWFLLYFLSAIILTICASANIMLRAFIYIPDFLGSVSALTRDSDYIQVTMPGSTLNGADRSRLLKDKRFIVQDVQPNEVVGRIAFSDAPEFVAVRQDRHYV